ncbi:uncharacterized protein K02A2.6-like [Uranotaenia lowii]|uniref:uncharacterized protein K02A2.6-like n=1 Tax=Uranotaenia lowii TaxID=190385 RepID=UPI00247B2048|nr:uncharacterized protein K02A2.6-like [Uranotaenia lowii]
MFGAPAGGGVEANDDGGQQIQRTLAQVIEAFDGYCVPQRNVAMEAFKFNGITQKERQTFTDFETALRTQVAYCEYECALKLLDGRNDSLAKVVETCKIFEAAAENKQLLDSKMPLSVVHTVEHPRETSETAGEVAVITRSGPKCYNCGQAFNRNHRRICPARNITCRGCNRQGHYQEFCISTRQQGNASADRSSSRGGAFSVRGSKSTGNKGVHSVNWVDTVQIHGRVELPCYDPHTRKTKTAPFLVVDSACEPLIGLKSCIDFGLVSRLDSIKTNIPCDLDTLLKCNSDLFEGLGKFPGTCTIQLKENSIPVLHYKKRIPMSLHERLKVDLNSMVQANIITPVDYPTDWVNNMQIVEKPNGSLRICLDPKPLNACIKREHFLIPKGEDILCRMSGKQIFTVLDLQNGFWQMELDRKSSDLTTFMTPFGRFRWNRVPFGISSAPEMFQKRMVQLFGDIPGVEVYFDDILIAGSDFTEHDCILTIVLERARDNNIRFNSSKVQYRTKRVKFMGHIITAEIQTDSSKHGLGSVILQQGRPVAYASRTLSGSEQKWAQIEKELLAIVFASFMNMSKYVIPWFYSLLICRWQHKRHVVNKISMTNERRMCYQDINLF